MSRAMRMIAKRCAAAIPTLLIVAAGAYFLLSLAPGDAVDAYFAETAGAGDAGSLRQQWGLQGGLLQRFLAFMAGALTLNFGHSIIFSRPVIDVIAERLPATFALMAGATIFAAGAGTLLGLQAGARPGGWKDQLIGFVTLLLNAIPNFWLGIVMIVIFAVQWPLFPVGGLRPVGNAADAGWLTIAHHLVLPILALGLGYLALYVRTMRAGMIAAWPRDHVRAAVARGLPEKAVIWRAVARPALLPVVVLMGQQAGALFGGSVVVETVFAIPGFGRLAYEAVTGRDTALLIGVALCATLFVLAANLIADLVLANLDPRADAGNA